MPFKSIRQKIAGYFLQREIGKKHRQQKAISLEEAKSFVVLYDATIPGDYELAQKYISQLQQKGKKVTSLGFFNLKELSPALKPTLNNLFITKKQLNWLFTPQSDAISNLIKTEFDVLINFVVHDVFTLTYIAALSKAHFKIGRYTDHHCNYYDFMIDIGEQKNLGYFMHNLDHYMEMIKTK